MTTNNIDNIFTIIDRAARFNAATQKAIYDNTRKALFVFPKWRRCSCIQNRMHRIWLRRHLQYTSVTNAIEAKQLAYNYAESLTQRSPFVIYQQLIYDHRVKTILRLFKEILRIQRYDNSFFNTLCKCAKKHQKILSPRCIPCSRTKLQAQLIKQLRKTKSQKNWYLVLE